MDGPWSDYGSGDTATATAPADEQGPWTQFEPGVAAPVQAPDLSKIKLSPYQQSVAGPFGESIKPPSGMESGTELLTAVGSSPVGRAAISGAESLGGQISDTGKWLGDAYLAMDSGRNPMAGIETLAQPVARAAGYQLGEAGRALWRPVGELAGESDWDELSKQYPKLMAVPKVVKGMVESAPKMAAQTLLGPEIGPAVWGLTDEGFDAKTAATMYALPWVKNYTGAIAENVASKMGINNELAKQVVNRVAGGTAMAGVLTGEQIDELRKLSPEERAKKAPETIGNALAMFAMGTLERGQMPKKPAKVTPMTGEALDMPEGSAVPPKVPFNLPDAARAPEPPVVPTAPTARAPMTQEEHASVYPVIKSDALVDGREQLNPDRVPNMSSIESSIDNPQILPGIREVPMSDFTLTGKHYSVEGQKKIDALAESIKDSGKISPLIVVRDSEGAYILEGATRADALFKLGAKSFPAKVVLDIGDIEKTKAPVVPTKAEATAHPAVALEKALDDPTTQTGDRKRLVTQTGLAMSNIEDLEKLVSLREKYVNTAGDKAAKTEDRFAAPFNGQSAREALEVATDSGSQIEAEIKPGLPKLGDRPLDWKKNPEVAKWFQDNAERLEKLGFQIPDELKAPKPAAPEKGLASDWTSATDETPTDKPGEEKPPTASLVNPPTGPTDLHAGISIPKFANRKMSPLDRVTASHSGKLQKSFDEARRAQREINAEVPSERRQNAISIWREAKGDAGTLQGWAAAAKGKLFKQAAIDAQTLTPKEIAIATKAGAAFDALHARGTKFDVLRSHRDAYVPHVWDVGKPGTGFGTGMLKQRFRFSNARTFDTFFDGDQAGFKPKTLAIGKLLPAYIHEMNKVIADRQAVRDIVAGTNKDGSPMAVPRGNAKVVDGDEGKAVLVQPRAMKEADTSDYRVMSDQPALANWTWASKDTAGRPVFMKSDLALHPDAYRRINAMIGQSALRQWYHDPVSGTAQIPRAVLRALDTAQSAMKREMFGLLAPFHQVQEGTHGIGHMVNPFSHIPKVDLRDPAQLDAANHGLMLLPDRASARVYLEGVGAKSSLLSQGIRKLGRPGEAVSDVIDGYQDYLFHQYIPGLKFKTYQAILGRNMKRYAGELKSGEMTTADVKITSAEQSNAAYGHLNYALLDRNPTMQHLIQMSTLAPDFLEARSRFAGQAVKGLSSPVGAEQLKAIAILAAVQAGSAYIISNVTGGQYDPRHPFEVVHNGRRYAMRSVPEDIFSLLKDTRQFAYSRVNPLLVKGGIQLATGLNYRGEKTGPLDTFTELLAGYIPITARQLPGLRSLTATSRQNPVSPLQQLAGSLGLRISRYSPVSETYKLAGKWMDSQKMDRSKGSYPISKYQQLRYALEDGDLDRAKTEYDALIKTATPGKIATGFRESINHPFTGKKSTDEAFAATLTGYDKQLYLQALRTRTNMLNAFARLPGMRSSAPVAPAAAPPPPWEQFAPQK